MTTYSLTFNPTRNTPHTSYFVSLGENKFTFVLHWNEYCNCIFLDIKDVDDKNIITGLALVNGLIIRNNNLPYGLLFARLDEGGEEPTIDNISEFAMIYDDGKE